MIKVTLLETNRTDISVDNKIAQVATDRVGYTVVQGTSTATIQVAYPEKYKMWDKSVVMTNAQNKSIRTSITSDTFDFNLPIEMTIAPYTKLLFQATRGDELQRWTIVDIPIAKTAEGQMPPIPSTDAEEIRRIANEAKDIADGVREEADSGAFIGPPGPQGPQGEGTVVKYNGTKQTVVDFDSPPQDQIDNIKTELGTKQQQLNERQLKNINDVPTKLDKSNRDNIVYGTGAGNEQTYIIYNTNPEPNTIPKRTPSGGITAKEGEAPYDCIVKKQFDSLQEVVSLKGSAANHDILTIEITDLADNKFTLNMPGGTRPGSYIDWGDGQVDYPKEIVETLTHTYTRYGQFNIDTNNSINPFYQDENKLIGVKLNIFHSMVPEYAYRGCKNLKSIILSKETEQINVGAFNSCSSLESITIPESVTIIGSSAFTGCNSLKNIHIPEGVTSIGSGAFSYCNSLKSINIPKGITIIENGSFVGCNNLKTMYLAPTTPPTFSIASFQKDTIEKFIVPKEAINTYKEQWAELADKIVYEIDSGDLLGKQDKTDNNLNTADKSIVGAINNLDAEKLDFKIVPIAAATISQAEAREIIENYKQNEGYELHFYTNGDNPTNFVAKGYVITDNEFNPHLIVEDNKYRYEYDTQGFRIISTTRDELTAVDTKATRAMQTAQQKIDKIAIKNAHDDSTENVYSASQTNNEIIDSFRYNFRQEFKGEYLNFENDGKIVKTKVNDYTMRIGVGNSPTNLIKSKTLAYPKHYYYLSLNPSRLENIIRIILDKEEHSANTIVFTNINSYFCAVIRSSYEFTIQPILIDLTEMFGAGNEPTTVEEVQQYLVPGKYYPYGKNIEPNMYAVKAEVNSLSMCPSDTVDEDIFPNIINDKIIYEYIPPENGYVTVIIQNLEKFLGGQLMHSSMQVGFSINSDYYSLVSTIPVQKGIKVGLQVNSQSSIGTKVWASRFIHAKEI